MARKYLGSPYRATRQLDRSDPLDELLHDAEGVSVGFIATYPEEFDRKVAELEANDELSDVGRHRALKKLVAEYETQPHIGEQWLKRAEKEARRLTAEREKRPTRTDLSIPEQIREEHRHNRLMLDFRALKPEVQRNKVWEAIDKAATSERSREFLYGVLDDGLLDEKTEERARTALRAGAHPAIAQAHEELLGEGGALTKIKFARDNYRAYLRERTGTALSAAQLAEQYGVPAPVVDEKRVFLTRTAASNAAVLRAATAEAQQAGVPLEVETMEQAFGPSNESGGTGSNGNGGGTGA